MNAVFLHVLSMSLSATLLAAAVLLVRPVLKRMRAPKWLICALWGILALRLVLPFSFESRLSAVPEPVASGSVVTHYAYEHWEKPEVQKSVQVPDPTPVQPDAAETAPVEHQEVEKHLPTAQILMALWLTGVGAMLLYASFSYWKIKKQVAVSVKEEGVWLCDHLQSPFILGFLRPRIYLPSDLSGEAKAAVLAHERAHLARRDHWWKPLGFLLLAFYWFNPVLWLCYVLLCRDIESACDEKVIRSLELEEKKAYSTALLSLSLPRRQLTACPLAFGEVGVKERVKNVLHYKKPAFWVVLAAVAAAVVLAVCFLTEPPQEQSPDGITPLKEAARQYDRRTAVAEGALWDDGKDSADLRHLERFMRDTEQGKASFLRVVRYYEALDPEQYDPQYYAAHRNEYPVHYVTDITYENGVYTTRCYGNGPSGKLITQTFTYLIKDSGQVNGAGYVSYLLSNDREMTYQRYMSAALSSVYNSDPTALGSSVILSMWNQKEPNEPAELPKQLAILAERKAEWMLEGKDQVAYAVTDLDRNGCLELIASYTMTSDHAPETHIWEVDLIQGRLNKCGNQGTEKQAPLFLKVPQDGVSYRDVMMAHSVISAWMEPENRELCLEVTNYVQKDALHNRVNKLIASFGNHIVEGKTELHKEFRVSGLESWYPGTELDVKYTNADGNPITEEAYDDAIPREHPTWLPMEVGISWICGADVAEKSQEEVTDLLWGAWQGFEIVPLSGLQIDGSSNLLYNPDFETGFSFDSRPLSDGSAIEGAEKKYECKWSVGDEKICSINQRGDVTALSVGKTTVTARYRGFEDTMPVEVKEGSLQAIDMGEEEYFIPLERNTTLDCKTIIFSAILSDGETERNMSFFVGDLKRPELVQWRLNGTPVKENQNKIPLKKPGRYVLTATVDGCSDSIELIVFDPDDMKLIDDTRGTSFELAVGAEERLSPAIEVGNDAESVAWEASYTCSDQNVLAVEPYGDIKGVAPGKATVTASYCGKTITYHITVLPKA